MIGHQPTGRRLLALHSEIRAALPPAAKSLLDKLIKLNPCERGCRQFANLGSSVVAPLRAAAELPDPIDRRNLSRALNAHLSANIVEKLGERPVTKEVIERAILWQPRLLEFLERDDQDEYWYPNDLFLKDYRFSTAITVPCGAQVIDLSDGIGPKTALKLARQDLHLLTRALGKPWFQIHTESRYLEEFNETGWIALYHTAVDLLVINPEIAGIVGTSWFYDPALREVSPRLFYLQDYPLKNGAYLVEQGTTDFDIESATLTSSTRRKMFLEGTYVPRCHTLIWPREAMINWKNSVPREGSA